MSFHNSKGVSLKFKSPLKNDSQSVKLEKDAIEEYQVLVKRDASLDDDISVLSSTCASSSNNVASVVSLLHEFNDIKDVTQIVLGKLASVQGKTLKELHEQFGLEDQE